MSDLLEQIRAIVIEQAGETPDEFVVKCDPIGNPTYAITAVFGDEKRRFLLYGAEGMNVDSLVEVEFVEEPSNNLKGIVPCR